MMVHVLILITSRSRYLLNKGKMSSLEEYYSRSIHQEQGLSWFRDHPFVKFTKKLKNVVPNY